VDEREGRDANEVGLVRAHARRTSWLRTSRDA